MGGEWHFWRGHFLRVRRGGTLMNLIRNTCIYLVVVLLLLLMPWRAIARRRRGVG